MGLVEAHHQEVVLVGVAADEVHRPGGAPVGKGELLRDVLLFHGAGLAGLIALLVGELLQIVAHVVPHVGVPAFGGGSQAEVIAAVQVPLADVAGVNALVGQALADGAHVQPRGHAVGVGAVDAGVLAGEERFDAHVLVAADHVQPLGVGHDQHELLFAHSLMPPPVTPAMIFSDRNRYRMKVGTTTIITEANSSAHLPLVGMAWMRL